MRDERELIRRAGQGDQEAFRQLVETYQAPAYRLALRMCGGDAARAEDAAQEAFLAAWRGLPRFRGDSRFSSWLYRLTTNAAIDFLREKYAGMPIVGMEPAVKPACLATRSGVVGVLATERSLDGELFRRTAARYGSGIEVLTYPGTGFVELVEGDREDTPEAEAAVRAAVEPLLARGADQSVLGGTHYPFLTPVMERIVDGRAAIVDPSPAVARRVGQLLDRYGLRASADNRPALTFRTFADELYRLRLERKVAAYL